MIIAFALVRTIAEPLRVAAVGAPLPPAAERAWIGGALLPAVGLIVISALWKAERLRATVAAGAVTVLAMLLYKFLMHL